MIGGRPKDVALISSVSEGAATVASCIPAGRVVVGAREFQSNLFPWLALHRRGFEVAEAPAIDSVVSTEALVKAIDDATVLVAVSEVQSSNGYRIELEAGAERCREVGARLFVNLTQALGVLRFDLARARPDFVVAHGYKWMLGPRGAAWLWVSPDRLDEMEPLMPSWQSPADPYAEYYGGPIDLAPDAGKLDTSMAWFPWVGARAALDLLLSLDAEAVESRALELARTFRDAVREKGFRTVPEEMPSQIVALSVADPNGLRERLRARKVQAAVRGDFLRLGFHGFNDQSDVDAGLEALGPAPGS
jgi:selenocysteine lyase/cysteine desulfurase